MEAGVRGASFETRAEEGALLRMTAMSVGKTPIVTSPSPGVPPGFVPVLPRGVDDAAVGFEKLVGDLEDRKHQSTLRTPGDMAAALRAPDEFAGLAFDALS